MTKEQFLTKRWNNWLTLGMGIPLLVLGIVFLSTNAMSDFSGFLVMVIYGAVY
jgi:hypothetical protein